MNFLKKLNSKWIRLAIAVFCALPAIAFPQPAHATRLADTVSINNVYVYQHMKEVNDQLYIVDYTDTYTVNPNENITDAYLVRLMNGAVELGSSSPYAYYNDGYDRGIASLYFSAADVTALGMTWNNLAYSIRFDGNPTLPWTASSAATAMGGAIADDGGVYTTQTTAANNATGSDMFLLPAVPVINDAYYFGSTNRFDLLTLNQNIPGAGVWAVTWEYFNGTIWSALTGVVDGTAAFTAAVGNHNVTFTMPTDWNMTSVNAITQYWIRARVSSYTSIVTQPLGAQCWVNSTSAPTTSLGTFSLWSSSGSVDATKVELGNKILYYADVLEISWSVDMISTTGSGSYLTSYGEDYFSNAVNDLQVVCPQIFSASAVTIDWEGIRDEHNYTQSYANTLKNLVVGNPLDLTPTANLIGIPVMWLSGGFWIAISAVIAYMISKRANSPKPAAMIMAIMIPVGVLIGWVHLQVAVIMGFIAAGMIFYAFFYEKASA